MGSITIRNLDDDLKRRLRRRAAEHNCSMEAEARDILRCTLYRQPESAENLADAMRRLVRPYGGFDVPSFPRGPITEPADFGT